MGYSNTKRWGPDKVPPQRPIRVWKCRKTGELFYSLRTGRPNKRILANQSAEGRVREYVLMPAITGLRSKKAGTTSPGDIVQLTDGTKVLVKQYFPTQQDYGSKSSPTTRI